MDEASNKVWGAAAHAIKAVAERRGWDHHAHAMLEEAVYRLVREEGAPGDLLIQYARHRLFTSDFMVVHWKRHTSAGKELIGQFIDTLESLG